MPGSSVAGFMILISESIYPYYEDLKYFNKSSTIVAVMILVRDAIWRGWASHLPNKTRLSFWSYKTQLRAVTNGAGFSLRSF